MSIPVLYVQETPPCLASSCLIFCSVTFIALLPQPVVPLSDYGIDNPPKPPKSVGPAVNEDDGSWARRIVTEALSPWTSRGLQYEEKELRQTLVAKPYPHRFKQRYEVGWWRERGSERPVAHALHEGLEASKRDTIAECYRHYIDRAVKSQNISELVRGGVRVAASRGDWPLLLKDDPAVHPSRAAPALAPASSGSTWEVRFPTCTKHRNGAQPNSPVYGKGYGNMLRAALAMAVAHPWKTRKPMAVFRGGGRCSVGCGHRGSKLMPLRYSPTCIDSRPRLGDDPNELGYSYGVVLNNISISLDHPRIRLARLSLDRGAECKVDAGISTDPHMTAALLKQGVKYKKLQRPAMKDLQQVKHRYIVHVEGNGYADRAWRELALGFVVLFVDNGYTEFWYSRLKPWVHYVPVRYDLSDLCDRISWCEANPNAAEQIANNAMEFARDHLTEDAVDKYVAELLLQLKDLQKPGAFVN